MVAVNILLLYEVFILSLRVLEWINLVTWSVNSFQLATIFGIVCCDTFVQQTLSDGLPFKLLALIRYNLSETVSFHRNNQSNIGKLVKNLAKKSCN